MNFLNMSGYFDILWEWNYMAQDKIWGANDEFMFAYAEFKEQINDQNEMF